MESSDTSSAETPTPPVEQPGSEKKRGDTQAKPKQREGKSRSGRRSNRNKGRGNNNRPKTPAADTPYGKVQTSFLACARCSYFFSSLRVLLTLDGLEKVVAEGSDGWLTTPWSHDLREHLERCYGIEIFADTTHYRGSCLECGRNFVATGDEDSAEMTRFELQAERLAPYPR